MENLWRVTDISLAYIDKIMEIAEVQGSRIISVEITGYQELAEYPGELPRPLPLISAKFSEVGDETK